MSCSRVREVLSLYVGGDLPATEAGLVSVHLQTCKDCETFHESLANNQLLLRSLRQDSVGSATLTAMREDLFARLQTAEASLGWWIQLERFLVFQMRRPRFAVAGLALMIAVSLTVLAQLRYVAANTAETASLEDGDVLRLPANYKDWVVIGDATELEGHKKNGVSQKVYMSPSAFRDYRTAGTFPEGTVIVLETIPVADSRQTSLQVSVKDSRFNGAWGYFNFESGSGQMATKARALPESAGCAACHRDRATTDHVFTQFYPALRSGSGLL